MARLEALGGIRLWTNSRPRPSLRYQQPVTNLQILRTLARFSLSLKMQPRISPSHSDTQTCPASRSLSGSQEGRLLPRTPVDRGMVILRKIISRKTGIARARMKECTRQRSIEEQTARMKRQSGRVTT
ncbi:hypothetical protein EYF80_008759 [Liparis tanakae]|uniref:Uncharacterized protein n=1 Tax=Liparis tanakae TaxID=230148 RepID=A0A4Z2IV64_9TELE|nr:hypothetical protein EYF80_008759 [Liparis tanakae]